MTRTFKIALLGTLILMIYALTIVSNHPGINKAYAYDLSTEQTEETTTPPLVVSSDPAITVPTFSRSTLKNQGICVNGRTHADYTNLLVSSEEVKYWAAKYWSGWNLQVAAALSIKEGQHDLNCIGDEMPTYKGHILYGAPTNDGRHYGESIGLYQYRTVIEATGKGGCEDITWQQGDIERETDCAFQKWDAHHSWTPWSMYTNGQYKQVLGQ